ncbi:MAG: arginine kinase, partial [Campylobacterota bacterium]|nr:arginine kinase [Campylobacterota bacterium]
MNYPNFTNEHQSLMAKYLTKELFEELKDLRTSNDFSLQELIHSGVRNPDSGIGAYAGDEESYTTFAALFDPIIEQYHGFSKTDKHQSNLNPEDLDAPNPDPQNKYIVSTRIRVGRNLKN